MILVTGHHPSYLLLALRSSGIHTFDDSFLAGTIFETDCVAYFLAKFDFHLFTNTFCNTHCCNPSRLSTPNYPEFTVSCLQQKLSKLSCLSRSCLPDNNDNLVVPNDSKKVFSNGKSGKIFSLFLQRLAP